MYSFFSMGLLCIVRTYYVFGFILTHILTSVSIQDHFDGTQCSMHAFFDQIRSTSLKYDKTLNYNQHFFLFLIKKKHIFFFVLKMSYPS